MRVRHFGSRRQDKARRLEALSRLRVVGRVYAPEADMRPVLPHRDMLLKAVAPETVKSSHHKRNSHETLPVHRKASAAFISRLSSLARDHADAGQMKSCRDILRQAVAPPVGVDPEVCIRAVAIGALQRVAGSDSSRTEELMNCFVEAGFLQSMPKADVGMILDLLVRGKLRRGDMSSAFRGELLSRLLDTKLRRGTYTALIERSGRLELGLALFHRAIAVGVDPNRKMLHAVLEACFSASDGNRARAVLAEMAARGIPVNGDTIRILLRRAPCTESVSAVLHLIQARDSRVRVSPHLAQLFIQAYLRTPADTEEETDRVVAKCFETIDWFFDSGVGVPHAAVDAILQYCVQNGRVEGALRAWREMRRGWLGPPGRKTRTMLWVMLESRPCLRRRLIADEVSTDELSRLRRSALAHTDNSERDMHALHGDNVKDQATVLHRWARNGRVGDAMHWIAEQVRNREGTGLDSRLVLAVLSDGDPGTRSKALDFCLDHLSSGRSVRGHRTDVVRRATEGIWRWIIKGEAGQNEGIALFDENVDRSELHTCLERVVRVVTEDGSNS